MAISLDNVLQTNTGATTASPFNATLPNATAEGSTVLLCVFTYGTSGPVVTGFTRDHNTTAQAMKPYVLRKSLVTGGENSWSVTTSGVLPPTIWFAMEIVDLHPLMAKDAGVATPTAGSGVTSISTGTTTQSTFHDGLAISFWGAHRTSSTDIPTISAATNDVELFLANSLVGGSEATAAAVGVRTVTDIGTYESTATLAQSANAGGMMVYYASSTSRVVANLDMACGWEFGTTAGWTTGADGCSPIDFANGSATISTTSPRTGSYCLRLTGTGAACNVGWDHPTGALGNSTGPTGIQPRSYYPARTSVRFVGSLPGADVAVLCTDTGTEGSGSGAQLFYRSASQKLGLTVLEATNGAGTEVLSANTVAADTWYDIDLMFDGANATRQQQWAGYWRINEVEQATAVKATLTTTAFAQVTSVRMGWTTASTATMDFDDWASSKHPGHYPLGPIKIYPLTVDPAVAATVTNSTAFSTFANNSTLTAWNATTARNAVDEIPPTIGGTADGFVQSTSSSLDLVTMSMQTRDGPSNLEAIRGVRWYFPGWAATTSAATIGFRSYDGTAETTLFAAADPQFDNSTTTPAWVCRMNRIHSSATPFIWTQAKLDALTVRIGYSTDASPAIGVHAILAELAMRPGYEQQVVENDGVFVYSILDPDTGNVIAIRLVAPADGDAVGNYIISGSPVQRPATAGGEDLLIVGAESNDVVSGISAERA